MIQKIICSTSFILLSIFGFCQSTEVTLAESYFKRFKQIARQTAKADSIDFYIKNAFVLFKKAENWEGVINAKLAEASFARRRGNYDKTKAIYDEYLPISIDKLGATHEMTSKVYNGLGIYYDFVKHDGETALIYFEKVLKIRSQLFESNDVRVSMIKANLGIVHENNGNYDEALKYQFEVLANNKALYDAKNPILTNSYNNIGHLYRTMGDYENALIYFKAALNHAKKITPPNYEKLRLYNRNIGVVYKRLEQYETALTYFNTASTINDTYLSNDNNRELMELYINKSIVLSKLKRHKEALKYAQKSLQIAESNFGKEDIAIIEHLSNLGNIKVNLNQVEDAIKIYKQGITIYKNQNRRGYFGNLNYYNIAETYAVKKQDYKTALFYLQQVFMSSTSNEFNFSDILINPSVDKINNKSLFQSLFLKAELLYKLGNQEHSKVCWIAAFDTYKIGFEALELIRKNIQTQSSKRQLLATFHQHFGAAQTLAYQLYQATKEEQYLKEMLALSQKSKSTVLYEAVIKSKVQKFIGIPDSIVQQERHLMSKIDFYKEKIYDLEQAETKETKVIQTYENRLAERQRSYDNLVKKLEKKYDHYHKMKYGNNVVPLQDIQAQLMDNELLLDYFVTDSTIFIYRFSSTDFQIYATKRPKDFKQKIVDLIALMSKAPQRNTLKTTQQDFIKNSGYLYQILLHKPLKEISKRITKLTIIPNGILGYVPFEILLTKPPTVSKFDKMPYLLRDFTVAYAYSLSLYQEQNQRKTATNRKLFAGFAPNYDDFAVPSHDSIGANNIVMLMRDGAMPLPGAIKEVNTIAKLLNGKAFINEQATETNFKTNAKGYNILHLSMHALLKDDNPLYSKMLFSQQEDTLNDGLLNAAELYNMKLDADLVALSACNTGLGQLSKGEGIMSLSRAFAYAGCSSTVMSLWKISDYTTSEIMVLFYKNLKQGMTKDEALRQAKLTYLDNTKAPELRHPYYWAGFISAGNMQPIDFNSPSNFPFVWIIGGLGLIVLLLLYRRFA